MIDYGEFNRFAAYLRSEGKSEFTPSGHKSTIYDYTMRIARIMLWEGYTREEFENNIGRLVCEYDVGGMKEEIGMKSNRSYINALRAYKRFMECDISKMRNNI